MGSFIEAGIANQLKKGQGETNDRLDALIREQQATNNLLRELLALTPRPERAQA